jgi:cytochrome c peroxidase
MLAFAMRWFCLLLVACSAPKEDVRALLRLPDHMALPAIPETNPLTQAKITLGRRLFYDKRLSGNQTQACASCHEQRLAFSDGKRTPVGSTGVQLARNSQALVNVAYNATLTWASDGLVELEKQIHIPLRADNPTELGISDGNEAEVLARFANDPEYAALFEAAFDERGVTLNKIIFALASFCRSLISASSPYDRFLAGDPAALSDQQKRGLALFEGERLECFHCHAGVNLTVSYRDAATKEPRAAFFNNGLYAEYPASDQGLADLTLNPRDSGRFRPPSLRNIALTAPYMHDGSLATLRDVLAHYASGGQPSALKSGLIRGFSLSQDETEDVLAFLDALTDAAFTTDPNFAEPTFIEPNLQE